MRNINTIGSNRDGGMDEHKPRRVRPHGAALFPLGRTLATPGALQTLLHAGIDGRALLARHESGDWGNMDAEDWKANDRAILDDTRVFSAYNLGDTGERVWIITEADRSYTTIMRPDEY